MIDKQSMAAMPALSPRAGPAACPRIPRGRCPAPLYPTGVI